jgi:Bacterial archaeo-eukaryotic release factor family 2
MRIDWLKPLLGAPGPFVTVYIDATRPGDGDRDVMERWKTVRRSLEKDGAPSGLLDTIAEEITRPTRVGGPHGRVIVANEQAILVDRVIKDPPAVQKGSYGPIPALLQAAGAADESVDYLRVVVDRLGADLTWSEAGGHLPYQQSDTVDGGHDVVNKTRTGGLSHKRLESRAEDSWERNAEVVAVEVERQVAAHRPEVILLSGDVRAVALLKNALRKKTLENVVDVAGGSRGAGVNEDAFEAKISEALADFRLRRRDEVLDTFRQEHGRSTGGVTGLGDVVRVLSRGQVKEFLLADEYGSGSELDGRQVWVGKEALQVALTRDGLTEIGATEDEHELPAAVALVRAALGQDSGLTFVPADVLRLTDGVGAVLRWHDANTPNDDLSPSMSADASRITSLG